MPKCLFCENELTDASKPEHILLDALGGRMTTRDAICSDCNNKFGGSIDKALTAQVEVIRNLLQLKSGSGDPPPGLRNIAAGSEKLSYGNDGRPKLKAKPFEVSDLGNGRLDVKILVQSEEEFRRVLPHLAAKLRMPEEEVKRQLLGGSAQVVERRPQGVHHHISLGSEDTLRSIAKSCFVLLATNVGTEPLRADAFAAARDFVIHGSEEFYKSRVFLDPRELPCANQLAAEFGELFNLIHVESDADGRVIGHFTLYNVIAWQIFLAESGGPKNVKIALASNPLNPANWSRRVAVSIDIPFSWLDSIDNSDRLTRARERLVAMMRRHVDQSREAEIDRIVNSVCSRYGHANDTDPIDPAKLESILREVASRVGLHALHLPYQEEISPARLREIIGLAEPAAGHFRCNY